MLSHKLSYCHCDQPWSFAISAHTAALICTEFSRQSSACQGSTKFPIWNLQALVFTFDGPEWVYRGPTDPCVMSPSCPVAGSFLSPASVALAMQPKRNRTPHVYFVYIRVHSHVAVLWKATHLTYAQISVVMRTHLHLLTVHLLALWQRFVFFLQVLSLLV